MRQVIALLVDSARLLRSRSLFWICLGLSAFAAIALFGTYSFNTEGVRFLWFKTNANPALATGTNGPRMFVSFIFSEVFIQYWLSWGAIILALISTASILPDFLADGAIELALCKPISRTKLFLVKCFAGVLFTLAQVTLGVCIAYLLVRVNTGVWLHATLLAIPAILLQFIYLYAVGSLIAVLTRSTIASLIGTLLFWFMVFIVQFSANQLTGTLAQMDAQAARQKARGDQHAADQTLAEAENWRKWKTVLVDAKAVVPKTGDLQKIVSNLNETPTAVDFFQLMASTRQKNHPERLNDEQWKDVQDASKVAEKAIRDIDLYYSLGTSLAFTVVVIGAATFVFVRRDS
jgi:ABC-type transport system involved in multi-copper enzyme maturation permease subunit